MTDLNLVTASDETKLAIYTMLTTFRLSNYGYDWRYFRSLGRKATRQRAKLRRRGCFGKVISGLDWANLQSGLGRRFQVDSSGRIEYVTGQSQNEEMINAAAQLAGYTGDWIS